MENFCLGSSIAFVDLQQPLGRCKKPFVLVATKLIILLAHTIVNFLLCDTQTIFSNTKHYKGFTHITPLGFHWNFVLISSATVTMSKTNIEDLMAKENFVAAPALESENQEGHENIFTIFRKITVQQKSHMKWGEFGCPVLPAMMMFRCIPWNRAWNGFLWLFDGTRGILDFFRNLGFFRNPPNRENLSGVTIVAEFFWGKFSSFQQASVVNDSSQLDSWVEVSRLTRLNSSYQRGSQRVELRSQLKFSRNLLEFWWTVFAVFYNKQKHFTFARFCLLKNCVGLFC